ncbi:MAG: DUF502 domain-containing protein [Gammaproteobacteria bacterium]|nr:MAG: DUF502 domain-containing protein [Gammaproteobacteria bacterium]
MARSRRTPASRFQRYILTGLFTAIPLWVTWVIFAFFLHQLTRIGRPWVKAIVQPLQGQWPEVARWLESGWLEPLLAILVTLALLYLLGWAATRVAGRRLLALLEAILERIPLIEKVYGATRQLIRVMQERPEGVERVVLIDFPSQGMKTVGLVMRVLPHPATGMPMAAVYVPTTPNPTSGYLELVPLDRIEETNWSLDEAMTFIISGGAVAPGAPAKPDRGQGAPPA